MTIAEEIKGIAEKVISENDVVRKMLMVNGEGVDIWLRGQGELIEVLDRGK